MLLQHRLDLHRMDLRAAAHDQLRGAAGEMDVAALVERGDLAGVVPAVAKAGAGGAARDLERQAQRRSLTAQQSFLAGWEDPTALVNHLDLEERMRSSDAI